MLHLLSLAREVMLCLFILHSEIQAVSSFVALGEPCMQEEFWHVCVLHACRAAETQSHSEPGFRLQALHDIFR